MITEITAAGNPKYKLTKSLLRKKERVQNRLFTAEGKKSVADAIAAKAQIQWLFLSESFLKTEEVEPYAAFCCFSLPDFLFENLCDTETPQGILAVIQMGENRIFVPERDKLYIFCDRIGDPGNLGTIIRTADAAGFGGVLLSEGCVERFSPKTVRASMGSFFHIPVIEKIGKKEITEMKNSGFAFYCSGLSEDTKLYTKADFTRPAIIAVGNEANGMSKEMLSLADACLKIPILGSAESLNVGVAAAVLMYEAQRQRTV